MSKFYRTSTTWVIDFRYDGHPRRWYKLLRPGQDARALMAVQLNEFYGERAQLVEARPATPDEEAQYLRGEAPGNVLCPTGRQPRTEPGSEPGGLSSNAARSTTPLAPGRPPPGAPKLTDPEA